MVALPYMLGKLGVMDKVVSSDLKSMPLTLYMKEFQAPGVAGKYSLRLGWV